MHWKILFMLGIISVLLVSGCAEQQQEQQVVIKQTKLLTEDGLNIYGTHYKGSGQPVILLHMLGRDRSTWHEFARELQNNGYNVLTIDFRGHGESDGDYTKFTTDDYQNMILDVEAAKQYLGGSPILVGASIGANTALNHAARYGARALVLLSPSLDYRGVTTQETASRYEGKVLIVFSEEDTQSASSRQLHNMLSNSELKVYNGLGHGTNMLNDDVEKFILGWIEKV